MAGEQSREELVGMLVSGWFDEKTGKHRYFRPGSAEEHAARRAAAHLLRDLAYRKKPYIGWLASLARLFNPAPGIDLPVGSVTAMFVLDITFRRRRAGNPGTQTQHYYIGCEMLEMVHADPTPRGAVKRACNRAMRKYRLDERTVKRIWSRHGKPFRGM
jgi:hypothetical protein